MRDISHFEVALRNAYDTTFNQYWQGTDHWLLDHHSPVRAEIIRKKRNVNEHNQKSILTAINRVRTKRNGEILPGKVIAELTLGFWASLTDKSREKTIWVPYLHHAFPMGPDRTDLDRRIGEINTVRNRLAHHEPLFDCANPAHEIPAIQANILEILDLLIPELACYVESHSVALDVYRSRP